MTYSAFNYTAAAKAAIAAKSGIAASAAVAKWEEKLSA